MRSKRFWFALLAAAWIAGVPAPTTAQTSAAETEFWQSVKDTKNAAELKAYLQAYPDGQFAPLAKLRIKMLVTGAGDPSKSVAKLVKPTASDQEETTASSAPPVHDCDRLAAQPFDPEKVAAGMTFDELDASRAIEACRKAIAAHPNTSRFHFQLGRAFHRDKSYGKALSEFRIAVEMGHVQAMNSVGLMYHGGFGVGKDHAQALKWVRKAAEQGNAVALANVCGAYIIGMGVAKDFDRAIAKCTEAIRRDPKYFRAYFARGRAYTEKGQFDRAIADYSEAIRLNPAFVLAYSNRGYTYEKSGRKADAIADFRKALLLDSSHALARKGLKRLGAKPF